MVSYSVESSNLYDFPLLLKSSPCSLDESLARVWFWNTTHWSFVRAVADQVRDLADAAPLLVQYWKSCLITTTISSEMYARSSFCPQWWPRACRVSHSCLKARFHDWPQIVAAVSLEVTGSFHSFFRKRLANGHVWVISLGLSGILPR